MKKFLCLLLALVSAITLCFTLTACDNSTKSLTYETLEDGTYAVTGITANETKVIIPEKKDGKTVTQIYEDAFRNKATIKEVVLPASIKKIGDSAFESTSALEKINLDNVEQLGKNAFKNAFCRMPKVEINLASIMSMGNNCFENALGLKSLTVGGTLTTIPKSGFSSCSGLTTVNLGNRVRILEENAFNGCASLVNLTSDGVKYIGVQCFIGCSALSTVNFPRIEELKEYSFNNCSFLVSVTLGPNLKQLYPYAFYGCSAISTFTLTDPVPSDWCYAMSNSNTQMAKISNSDSCQGQPYKHLLNDPAGFAARIRTGAFNRESCFMTLGWVTEHGFEVGQTYNSNLFK